MWRRAGHRRSESRYRQAQLQMDFLVEAGGHSALVAEIEQSTTNARATWEHEMSQVEVLPQTPVPASPIAHFPSLIDQAPESVEEIIGTPVQFGLWGSAGDDEFGVWTIKSTGKNAQALVGIYLDRQLEVLYIEGKARRLKLWLRAYRLLYPTDRASALPRPDSTIGYLPSARNSRWPGAMNAQCPDFTAFG